MLPCGRGHEGSGGDVRLTSEKVPCHGIRNIIKT